jgi:hypothetical protein
MRRSRLFTIAVTLGAALALPSATRAANDDNHNGSRVQSWAVGHITPLPTNTSQYNNQTLRAIVQTSVGGNEVRVRVANFFGTSPLVIGAAHVAVSSSGSSIVAGSDRTLTFGGRASVSIPAGALALSDPVDLHVDALSNLAVSLYLPSATKAETTTLFQGSSYVSSVGNFVGAVDLPGATALSEWPFVSGVSVSIKNRGQRSSRSRIRRPSSLSGRGRLRNVSTLVTSTTWASSVRPLQGIDSCSTARDPLGRKRTGDKPC